MSINKQEYIKNIKLGIYEVLDIAGYGLKDANEIVEKAKVFLIEDRITEIDLLISHYAHVVTLLNAVNEWDTVVESIDSTIKEVLDKTYLDREAVIIENEIIKILVDDFDKDEKTAIEIVDKVDIRKQIDGYSLLLHFCPMDWALSILTKNKDIEALSKQCRW